MKRPERKPPAAAHAISAHGEDAPAETARARATATLHASAVAIGEAGILILGAPGSGKSTLALHLIDAAGRRGHFARLVGDDRIEISVRGKRAILRPHPAIAGKVEKRWQGIVNEAHEPAAALALTAELVDKIELLRMPETPRPMDLAGVIAAPRLPLPVFWPPGALALRILDLVERDDRSYLMKSANFGLAN